MTRCGTKSNRPLVRAEKGPLGRWGPRESADDVTGREARESAPRHVLGRAFTTAKPDATVPFPASTLVKSGSKPSVKIYKDSSCRVRSTSKRIWAMSSP